MSRVAVSVAAKCPPCWNRVRDFQLIHSRRPTYYLHLVTQLHAVRGVCNTIYLLLLNVILHSHGLSFLRLPYNTSLPMSSSSLPASRIPSNRDKGAIKWESLSSDFFSGTGISRGWNWDILYCVLLLPPAITTTQGSWLINHPKQKQPETTTRMCISSSSPSVWGDLSSSFDFHWLLFGCVFFLYPAHKSMMTISCTLLCFTMSFGYWMAATK